MRTGPDDARHVIWAIGKSFSFYFMFFLKNINYCFYSLLCKATRMGPDNARHIVWAMGRSVPFYFVFF